MRADMTLEVKTKVEAFTNESLISLLPPAVSYDCGPILLVAAFKWQGLE
jgi:hypothetical protein